MPGDGANVIHAGPIRLDLEQRRVRSLGKNARLTPRLAMLLQILLQHRGEVIDGGTIERTVDAVGMNQLPRTMEPPCRTPKYAVPESLWKYWAV